MCKQLFTQPEVVKKVSSYIHYHIVCLWESIQFFIIEISFIYPLTATKTLFRKYDHSFYFTDHESRQRNSSHSSNSGKSSIVSAQDELAEIINDFKNNVFTIAEVEKLVESWQNRHDVQQSFIDKQVLQFGLKYTFLSILEKRKLSNIFYI